MEFPLSLTDSTRHLDTRPVEFPLSLADSTRAEATPEARFGTPPRGDTPHDTREFPLSLTDSERCEGDTLGACPVEFPLSLTARHTRVPCGVPP